MKTTNKYNLPEAVYKATMVDSYTSGGAFTTATGMIGPPRIATLRRRHDDKIVVDCSDRIWILLGKSMHQVLENEGVDNALVEERLFAEVEGKIISGASDVAKWVLKNSTITDYKLTSIYVGKNLSRLEEWTQQQNVYAWLFRQYGFEVTHLNICAVFRDYSKKKARREAGYPPPAMVIALDLWTEEEAFAFITERVKLLKSFEDTPDDDLPPCTMEEKWQKPDLYAVKKAGNKSACRGGAKLESMDAAKAFIEDAMAKDKKKITYMVEKRPSEPTRCLDYCDVAPFCNQFQQWLAAQPKIVEGERE